MCWVMPPDSPSVTFDLRMASSSEVLPWSTWPMMVTTGAARTRLRCSALALRSHRSSQLDLLLERDDHRPRRRGPWRPGSRARGPSGWLMLAMMPRLKRAFMRSRPRTPSFSANSRRVMPSLIITAPVRRVLLERRGACRPRSPRPACAGSGGARRPLIGPPSSSSRILQGALEAGEILLARAGLLGALALLLLVAVDLLLQPLGGAPLLLLGRTCRSARRAGAAGALHGRPGGPGPAWPSRRGGGPEGRSAGTLSRRGGGPPGAAAAAPDGRVAARRGGAAGAARAAGVATAARPATADGGGAAASAGAGGAARRAAPVAAVGRSGRAAVARSSASREERPERSLGAAGLRRIAHDRRAGRSDIGRFWMRGSTFWIRVRGALRAQRVGRRPASRAAAAAAMARRRRAGFAAARLARPAG